MRKVLGIGVLLVVGFGLWSWAGNLEPPGPPAPTMKTLDEVAGAPDPDLCFDNAGRFVVCGNGTVKDNLTGLFWLEDAKCFPGGPTWAEANIAAAQLADGQCGLTDGSSPGDWRLPTADEWQALIDQANANACSAPFFPDLEGRGCCGTDPCAFIGVQATNYWTSTTVASSPSGALAARLFFGSVGGFGKASTFVVWPVRDGQ